MDRTKEPGALGEPLYQDVVTALAEARADGTSSFAAEPVVVGGRYGLSSKEFTPAMVKAIFDDARAAPPEESLHGRHHGRRDAHVARRTTTRSTREPDDVTTALFYGLGADGTVGANKNSIKIIGEETDRYVQGYFVYDSKKSGATTVSHLRTSPRPIRSAYLISKARFVACHQFEFLERIDVLEHAVDGAVFLLNAPYDGRRGLGSAAARGAAAHRSTSASGFYTIDASSVATRDGHGRPDQHDHADVLLRDLRRPAARRGHRRRSSTPSRRPTASAARRSSSATSRPSTPRSPSCTR